MKQQCTIIAEAGVNHNGDLNAALELVDRAAEAGADFVKFQTFRPAELASHVAPKAAYQTRTTDATESQLDMLRRLELTEDAHQHLIERCAKKKIGFLSTPFDLASLHFLTRELNLQLIKLGSGDLTNAPLLLAAGRSGARIILSTGMGTLSEVEQALGVIAYGILAEDKPSTAAFRSVLNLPEAWKALQTTVTLLHCTTEYPAAVEDTNLSAMTTMRQAYGLPVGYSDHTEGNAISFAAVAMGASVIEKHFTLDRKMSGPDHAASLEPAELVDLVQGIRDVEVAIGTGIKRPGRAELANRIVARKSLIASRDLPAGTILSEGDIRTKRPGGGLSAMLYWEAIGKPLAEDVTEGSYIRIACQMDPE